MSQQVQVNDRVTAIADDNQLDAGSTRSFRPNAWCAVSATQWAWQAAHHGVVAASNGLKLRRCPLLRVKRICPCALQMSASDPKLTQHWRALPPATMRQNPCASGRIAQYPDKSSNFEQGVRVMRLHIQRWRRTRAAERGNHLAST